MRISLAMALLLLPTALFAQSVPATTKPPAVSVTLVYHEDNTGIFDVKDANKVSVVPLPQDGDKLKEGWTVITGPGDVAELKLDHTSTIIKLAGSTNFTIGKLRTATGGQDVFALGVGRVRTVAGKASGKDQYQIKTQSAVCGVRGSDVVIESLDGIGARLCTLEGTGWIQNAAGDALDVTQGFEADTLATEFRTFEIPPDILQGLLNDMKFTRLDVNETLAVNKDYQVSLKQGGEGTPSESTKPPAPQSNSTMDNILTALGDILGFEIGSLNVPDPDNPGKTLTYAKAVFSPTFTIGKVKTALYLPVIYQGDMFNQGEWYRPAGNNEWSFGQDQHGQTNQLADAGRDLLLKIRYIEYGTQRDPFFLKVGNLNDITLGHGLVMRNFANDADFPAVRHVGINIGADFKGGGFEAMVNDVAPDIVGDSLNPPDIMGLRLYFRPIPSLRLAIGISGVVDMNPARDYVDPANGVVTPDPDAAGNPIFLYPGVDLDMPFVETNSFGLVAFADVAALAPYFRTVPIEPAYAGIATGFVKNAVYDKSAQVPLKNWGSAAGIFGNLIIPGLTYRVEFRYYTGAFQPTFYGAGYERGRSQYVKNVLDYVRDPTADAWNGRNMGFYGEGGFRLNRIFSLGINYFWPWTIDSSGKFTADPNETDHFGIRFNLEKGVIPVVNLWGSISYERTNFIPELSHGGLSGSLFDANTVVSAQVNYPVSPIMDVSLIYTTTAARDAHGNLYYKPGAILPEMSTSLAIQTQVHL